SRREIAAGGPGLMPNPHVSPLTQRQAVEELSELGSPFGRHAVNGWHESCTYLDGEPFAPTSTGYPRDKFERIKERIRGVQNGRWQESNGRWWISVKRTFDKLDNPIVKKMSQEGDPRRRKLFLRIKRIWEGLKRLDQRKGPLSCLKYKCEWFAETE